MEIKLLFFCDLLFNVSPMTGLKGLLFRVLGSTGDGIQPKITSIGKIFCNKNKIKPWFSNVAKRNDIKIICPGHGNIVTDNCSVKLQRVSDNL